MTESLEELSVRLRTLDQQLKGLLPAPSTVSQSSIGGSYSQKATMTDDQVFMFCLLTIIFAIPISLGFLVIFLIGTILLPGLLLIPLSELSSPMLVLVILGACFCVVCFWVWSRALEDYPGEMVEIEGMWFTNLFFVHFIAIVEFYGLTIFFDV